MNLKLLMYLNKEEYHPWYSLPLKGKHDFVEVDATLQVVTGRNQDFFAFDYPGDVIAEENPQKIQKDWLIREKRKMAPYANLQDKFYRIDE